MVLISSAPSDIEQDWFLTNEQMAAARDKVNKRFGSRRLFSHAIFTPGQRGWLEKVDAALELKPESMKGYTIGDNTHRKRVAIPGGWTTRRSHIRATRNSSRHQERLRA